MIQIYDVYTPKHTYQSYDGVPVLYLDTQNALVVWAGSIKTGKRDCRTWLVARLTETDVAALETNEIDLYTAFRQALSLTAVTTKDFEIDRIKPVTNVGDKWLPTKGEYA